MTPILNHYGTALAGRSGRGRNSLSFLAQIRAFVLGADLLIVPATQAWRFAGFGFLALYARNALHPKYETKNTTKGIAKPKKIGRGRLVANDGWRISPSTIHGALTVIAMSPSPAGKANSPGRTPWGSLTSLSPCQWGHRSTSVHDLHCVTTIRCSAPIFLHHLCGSIDHSYVLRWLGYCTYHYNRWV